MNVGNAFCAKPFTGIPRTPRRFYSPVSDGLFLASGEKRNRRATAAKQIERSGWDMLTEVCVGETRCALGNTNGSEDVVDSGGSGEAGQPRVERIRRPTPLNLSVIEQQQQNAGSSVVTWARLRAVRARRRAGNRFVWMLNESPVSVVCT